MYEAHTTLDQTRGEQAPFAEVSGGLVRAVEAVRFAGGLRLAHHVEGLWGAELHFRGEFVPGDAGGESRVAGMLRNMGPVHLIEQGETIVIGGAGGVDELFRSKQVGNGL